MTKCDAICYIQHAFSLAFGRLIVDNMDMNFVAYVRTSTRRQNLGLESQRAIIEAHVAAVGGKLLAVYSEQECGEYETAKRPALSKAIGHAKRSKATLIVAYLSRLARSAAVGTAIEAELRRAGTAVHVCDKPGADTLTLTIYFGLAERELENIRSRTRNSLTVLGLSRAVSLTWDFPPLAEIAPGKLLCRVFTELSCALRPTADDSGTTFGVCFRAIVSPARQGDVCGRVRSAVLECV